MDKAIEHVAIIPDGNRRWAKEKGLSPWKGHYEGAKRIEEIVRYGKDLGITHLTIWGGSYNNLTKRTKKEIAVLDTLYRKVATELLKNKNISTLKARVRFLGEWASLLRKETVEKMREVEQRTKSNTSYDLTYLIGYNGDREMLSAIKKLIKTGDKVSSETLKKHLWTKDLPPVDLVIRTGNEPHLSTGFMMWETRNAYLLFSDKMWPAFGIADLKLAIEEFRTRERRFGK